MAPYKDGGVFDFSFVCRPWSQVASQGQGIRSQIPCDVDTEEQVAQLEGQATSPAQRQSMGAAWPEAADVSPGKDTCNKFKHDSSGALPVAAVGIECFEWFGSSAKQLKCQTIAGGESSSPWYVGSSAGMEDEAAGNRQCNSKQECGVLQAQAVRCTDFKRPSSSSPSSVNGKPEAFVHA
mmetsp:Transcript_77416/g.142246  ORF Transcript_77416/g.142246 Transcript_77416/m.142246 type:complete len:180 (+) Transcript_77416:160-699(+)